MTKRFGVNAPFSHKQVDGGGFYFSLIYQQFKLRT